MFAHWTTSGRGMLLTGDCQGYMGKYFIYHLSRQIIAVSSQNGVSFLHFSRIKLSLFPTRLFIGKWRNSAWLMLLETKEMQLSQKSRQVHGDGVHGALYL